ncbi:Ig-like domain-containing protein [Paucibacter sp. Y2R2-4]|uniref:Ig-like domain-containing protein n=1 Tax=Paucibacter sp. Y2R2-4 TaxID=2893553 RepID=UPI0021E4FF57|nr:Ig-like domain-containing protein [Paucibacter sp. Y2R2-4]
MTARLAADSDTGTQGDTNTSKSIVTLEGTSEAKAFISLRKAGASADLASIAATAAGTFSFASISLDLGENAFDFRATDLAGNTRTLRLVITRSAPGDAEPPKLSLSLANDTGVSKQDAITADPTVKGAATDDVGVAKLFAALDPVSDVLSWTDLSSLLGPDGSFTVSRAVLDTLAGGKLADGAHDLRMQVSDAAGNTSSVARTRFTLDTHNPQLTSFGLSVADASNAAGDETSAATVQLKGLAEAGATVQLAAQGLSGVAGLGGAFVLPGVALKTGANLIELTVTDAAGNSSSLSRTITRNANTQPDAVLAWNQVALRAIQLDVTDPPVATRVLAAMSLAQYDALAAIEGTPAFLVQRSATGDVSAQAAAAQAAYRVLYALYPGQRASFDAALATSLGAIPESSAKAAGIALGESIARAIIEIRANDGYLNFVADDGSTAIGKWRPTGPMFLVAQDPQWAQVTPFALTSPSEFRAPPPPSLDSAEYAAALNQVKSLGSATGSTRTADQTQQAHFWADGAGSYTPPGHWNQIAEQVALAKGNSLSANARLMAQLNVALADAAIACWDTKYNFDLWRPVTAIQNADQDGNAATTQDANWAPLLITPPHPSYVSGHSSFSAAAASVLAATFGDNTAFATTSATLPGVTRNFTSFSQAADEAGMSRIYGGIHTTFDNEAGKQLGAKVGKAVLDRFALTEDKQAPTIALADSPAASNTNPKLTGQVLDNLSGVASAQVSVDQGAWQDLTLDATGRFSFSPSFKLDGTADGVHAISIIAKDAAGNVSKELSRSFTLDTKAPTVNLSSLADGDKLSASSRLTGTAAPNGSTLASLSYQIDGGTARTLNFDASTGKFDEALVLRDLSVGDHTLTLTAKDAAGNVTTLSRTVKLDQLAPFTITKLTPAAGSGDVGVTFRPQVFFSRAVNPATLTADSFYATGPDGAKVPATIVPALDGSFAWLFFTNPMPGGSNVTLHLKGSSIRAAGDGAFLDGDSNGSAGGDFAWSFTTVSTTSVLGAKLSGKVVDPGADLLPMTFDDIRRGPDGVIHTADDVFLNPIVHAKVFIVGRPDLVTYTDANGNFSFDNVPVGNVKVGIDGRTATNTPDGIFWPEMVMDTTLRPGITNTLMGSMGSTQSQNENADRQEVYLPRVQTSALQTVSNTAQTTITVDEKSAPDLTDEQRGELKLVVAPGSAVGADGKVLTDVKIGVNTVPPELIKDMMPAGLTGITVAMTIQAPGVASFQTPVELRFPNVYGMAPGEKTSIFSFDHNTGRLVITGTGTVSPDGKAVVSDAGSGILAPGWYGPTPPGCSLTVPNDPPKKPDPKCDPTGVGLSLAGLALGGAAIGLASTVSAPVVIGLGLAGAALGAYDEYRQWNGQTPQERGQALAEFGATSVVGTGLGFLPEDSPRTVTTITNTRFGLTSSEVIGRGSSLASKAGKALGWLGVGLSLRDLYNRAKDCLDENGILGRESQLLMASDTSFSSQGLESVITFLQRQEAAANEMTAALQSIYGNSLKTVLPDFGRDVFMTISGGNIVFLDIFGDSVKSANGLDAFSIAIADLSKNIDVTSDVVRDGLLAYSLACQKMADAYTSLPDVDNLLREVERTYSMLIQHETIEASGLPNSDGKTNTFYSIVDAANNVVLRGVGRDGSIDGVLAANSKFFVSTYDIQSNSYGYAIISTGSSGVNSYTINGMANGRIQPFTPNGSLRDSDFDGLADAAEEIIGTSASKQDSDHDGISDLAEILQGLDPLGGIGIPTGLVGAVALKGNAQQVVVIDGTRVGDKLTALVATGTQGLAVIDVSQFTKPQGLAEIGLPGNSADVAADANRGLAAIAANDAGLHIVDISTLASPRLVQTVTFPSPATHVKVRDGIAYVATGTNIAAVDLNTGEQHATVDLGALSGSTLLDIAIDGNTLFTLDASNVFRAIGINGDVLTLLNSLTLPSSATNLFVGGGVAYAGAGSAFQQGFSTVDVRDPTKMALLSGPDAVNIAGGAFAANGSGLGVAVGSLNGIGNVLHVVDVSDPTRTDRFVTQINLPAAPRGLALANGLAFVADGTGGLQIVNYASFDTKGKAPTVSVVVDATDADPATTGTQVLEGRSFTVRPAVTDDVQVRNVELLVNGVVVANDPSFPFDFTAQVPTIAAAGNKLRIQVRATDTGGNATLSDAIVYDVVPDTFAPVLKSVSVEEGAKRFFVRSVDFAFDEPLDTARLTTAAVQLVRAGADGKFGTADDVVAPVTLDFRSQGQRVSVLTSGYLPPGDYQLTIQGSAISDKAGNKLGADIVRKFTIRPASDVRATVGTPEILTAPSANPMQQIGISVPFDPASGRAQFGLIDANGNRSTTTVSATRWDSSKGIAYFTVPTNAVTGDVTVYGMVDGIRTDYPDGTFPLQIVPVVSNVQVQSVSADGSSAVVVLTGRGFVEGNNSEYRFGTGASGAVITDAGSNVGPDVQQVYDYSIGQYINGQVVLTVPLSNGVFGPISVKTGGGTSATFSLSLTSVQATALSGTPADANQASANPGQAITLVGTGLTTDTDVLLRFTNYSGNLELVKLNPIAASADGKQATLVVPIQANGAFTLQIFGSASQPLLQIVPTLKSFDDNGNLYGAGFVEGNSTYRFPGRAVVDTDINAGADVSAFYDPNVGYYYGGNVRFDAATLTRYGQGALSVTTAGGTSAPITLTSVRPGSDTAAIGQLSDVAVAADGSLWTIDTTNPGHILRIDPASGQVLQTITLDGTNFGGSYTANYAGLQVLPQAMSLGGKSVPAGSLLLFNGNYNQIVAVNPSTGSVIAKLSPPTNYTFTAGLFDATSGHLFALSQNYNQLIELNPTNGAEIAKVNLPINIQSWAGMAIDPSTGDFWIGGANGGSQLVQVNRAGVEQRRVDISRQFSSGSISGLAFAADGTLRVSSTSGSIFSISLSSMDYATLPATLTQVNAIQLQGTAAQNGVAAANVGQVIELIGTNFGANTQVLFNTRDNAGNTAVVSIKPSLIDASGTRLQVLVPDLASSGDVRVVNTGIGGRDLGFGSSYTDAIYRGITTTFTAGSDTATIRFADGGLEALNNESWGLDNVIVKQGATEIFRDNFEGGSKTNWSNRSTNKEALATFGEFSGRFNNASQTLNLTGLTAGQTYTLSFDAYIIDTWDGSNPSVGPDVLQVSADGKTLWRESFANGYNDSRSVQTYGASASIRLQIVPTLASMNGAPGTDNAFTLNGSGFMEGATTLTVGGVSIVDPDTVTNIFDVSGNRNNSFNVVAPLTLDGPVRITTEGGWVELPGYAYGVQPLSQFSSITVPSSGQNTAPTDASQPWAITGQFITLIGQGFTNNTLVQFQGIDDSGKLGTITRTGSVSNNGTTLTIEVPALARTGDVTVLGSGTSIKLQIAPTLRAYGGTVAAGNTIVLEGTGLTVNDLVISIDGQGVGNFTVRTINDSSNPNYRDQQLITLTVPAGVSAGVITVSTAGGVGTLRAGALFTVLPALTPTADGGDTLSSALSTDLAPNQSLRINASIGSQLDVDLYRVELRAAEQITLSVSNNNPVYLRLFDASGRELLNGYRWSGDSASLRWVAPTAGTYYIGISGYNNTAYNPNTANSGGNGSYTGGYALTIERLAAGVSHLSGITANASSGTPTNAGVASANTGQTITLNGAGLRAGESVVFSVMDDSGNLFEQAIAASSVAADGNSLTVVVPTNAATGTVRLARDTVGIFLQIVPTLTDVTASNGSIFNGGGLTLQGSGFAEGSSVVLFGSTRVNDLGRGYGLDVYSTNSTLGLTVPPGAPSGPISVRTVGGTSAAFGLKLTGISATATSGSAANGAHASANPGQVLTLSGQLFDFSTDVVFETIDANGNRSELIVRPTVILAGGTQAQVVVPANAVTGNVRVAGDFNGASFPLQIVPVVSNVQVQSVSADGSSAVVVLTGRGFVEGNNSEYRFGTGASGAVITDAGSNVGPDVQQVYDYSIGQYINGQVVLTVPLSNGVFGPISVKTGGGTSATFSLSLTSVQATALSGTPADANQASANPGQAITLVGTGLTTDTDVLLRFTNYSGNLELVKLNPIAASADGKQATLVVPIQANGAFTLQIFGSASQPLLQIVPTLKSFDDNGNLYGAGFVEGNSTYRFPGRAVVDTDINAGADVSAFYDPNVGYYYGGNVRFDAATLTRYGQGALSVTTAGGTSAPITLTSVRPGSDTAAIGQLSDVAVAADGSLWTIDTTNPGHILRIDPASGQVLQTITLDGTNFGGSYTANYAGLQVLPQAMSLGGKSVPAGSLLLFNGNYNQIVAVNPSTGSVIAKLSPPTNYTFTAGLFDATSGHLFALSQNYNQLIELNPTNGAEIAKVNLPINIQSWAGMAIDPSTGDFWIGGANGGSQLVQVNRAGVEQRRVDISRQFSSGSISGLAFAADGTLRVSSTSGSIFSISLSSMDYATLPATLTQVNAIQLQGTAAQNGVAAANVGQVIELIGTNFGANTQVLFNTRDNAGNTAVVSIKPSLIDASGTRLQVLVPDLASSGDVRVVNTGIGGRDLGFGSSYTDAIYRGITTTFTAGSDTATIRFADGGLEALNNESWGLDNVIVKQGATEIFRDNFEGGSKTNWSNRSTNKEALATFGEFSGRFNNASQTLNLTGLTAGQTYTLSFDAYIIDTWDGSNPSVGPDVLQVSADGKTLWRESFANGYNDSRSVQTYGASASIRLQIVPTLASMNGAPGTDNAFTLNGSGFMEGATTLTVGGVSIVDPDTVTNIFDVSGNRNNSFNVVAPLTLDGPVRITTEGGWVELPGYAYGVQPLSQFSSITVPSSGQNTAPTDASQPWAITGQFITLIGQGFTNNTLVQFQGIDDSGKLGTITRTGSVSNNGTTLTIEVPALARTGDVTVLGSGTSIKLQIAPTLRAYGGTVAAGNTIVLEGTGLTVNDLVISIDGQGVGNFTVRTINDSSNPNYRDQQLITLTVPAGVSAGVITVSTAGGVGTLRAGALFTVLPALTPTADGGDTLSSALSTDLAPNQSLRINASIGSQLDVDLYRVELRAAEQITLSVSNNNPVYLRLFDASGRELLNGYRWSGDSASLRWVAPTAGTYYIGISGYNNTAYNPNTANSGGNGSYTGGYALTIERLAAGVSHLSGITANASSGTPTNAGVASANTGQTITLNGAGLRAGESVVFSVMDDSGNLFEQAIAASSVAADGNSLTVVVPTNAATGTVRLARDTVGIFLQIVPTLTDVTASNGSIFNGGGLTLQGSGFAEGSSVVLFGSTRVNDLGRGYGLDVYSTNSTLGLTVPPGAPSGPISVRTVGGTSAAFGLKLTGISATATSGSAANGAHASANPGQVLTLSGQLFDFSTDVVFETIDANGNRSELIVRPTVILAGGTQAQVVVPANAVTGNVRVAGDFNGASFPLQIVPVVSNVQVQSVSADGSSAVVVLTGRGFVEGNNSEYRFGTGASGAVITDAGSNVGPDVQQVYDYSIGQYINGQVVLTVPLSNGVFGPISVKTGGGTSATFSLSLTSVQATALSGTPADANQASANPGQAITLVGTGLTTDTDVLLRFTNYSGNLELVKLNPIAASADGKQATLVVPIQANGAFTLQIFGSASQPLLQIVPTLKSFDDNGNLYGAGFVEGNSTYRFPGRAVVDTDINAGADVSAFYDPNVGYYYGGNVRFDAATLTRYGQGALSVTTAGGTSAPITLTSVRPGSDTAAIGQLSDVAVAADGSLWTIDTTNPGHILRIDPASGQVLQTITLDGTNFGGSYTANYAGLQVLPQAMSLGGKSVPAGSLLLFNGNYNQIVAVNPSTGSVIAKLSPPTNYTFTAGLFDATSGHLFALSQNYNQLIELNPTNGAEIAKVNLPINIQSWAGMAIDPSTGDFWIGGANGGSQLVQVNRAGVEQRRVDISRQFSSGSISGLAFAADGTLRVSSTSGSIFSISLSSMDYATLPATLTQVNAIQLQGTAAQNGVAAANVGQVIELIGTNFGANTQVLFNTRDNAGNTAVVSIKPSLIDASGTRLQVLVPDLASSGDVRVVNTGIGGRDLGFGSSYTDAIYRGITTTFTAGSDTATIRFADGGLEALNNESWGLDNVIVKQGATEIFRDNFEGGSKTNWSNRSTNKEALATFGEFSGRFNNASQTLNLTGLTAGQTYTLSFDAYIIDTWDGSNPSVGPDVLQVSADGKTLWRESFANGYNDSRSVQTYGASASIRLQIVPTLASMNGAPGTDNAFTLNGSGFMEGATTLTVGGVSIVDPDTVTNIFDVSGNRNNSFNVVAPLTLDGPVRITTEGGWVELPGYAYGVQPLSQFSSITVPSSGQNTAPTDASQPWAITGQFITLIGQGFTNNTLVQFQGIDDSGKLGTITRTGSVSNNGTTLTIEVPALARTGDVTVLGSGTSIKLQIAPTLRAYGGTVAAGNTIVLEGTGLTVNDLVISIDGQGVGNFTVRTINDSSNPNYRDQQLITLTVPAGVSAGVITVSTAGGVGTLRAGALFTVLPALTPTADGGDTLSSALSTDLAPNQSLRINASIGSQLDVDLYRVELRAAEQITLSVSNNNPVYLRLFDASGRELLNGYRWSGDSASLRWVAPTAGTYYIGISGYNNTAYNPNTANSGGNGSYTGGYALTIERLAAGVSHLSGITANASSGTPTNAGVASANTGQTITLNGAGLRAGESVVFSVMDDSGNLFEQAIAASSVAADGNSLTVVVPTNAATGTVRLARDTVGIFLQIVPTLTSATAPNGNALTLTGTGYSEGVTSILLPDFQILDISRAYGVDVYSSNTGISLTTPLGASRKTIQVRTVGGVSQLLTTTLP